jgi:hypothetical protein
LRFCSCGLWCLAAAWPGVSVLPGMLAASMPSRKHSKWQHRADVLVVDNGGRLDEACVGDLVALEAQAAGVEGMVIWGLHRDTADIWEIRLAVFSLGAIPTDLLRLDARAHDALESAVVGHWAVSREDLVLGRSRGGKMAVGRMVLTCTPFPANPLDTSSTCIAGPGPTPTGPSPNSTSTTSVRLLTPATGFDRTPLEGLPRVAVRPKGSTRSDRRGRHRRRNGRPAATAITVTTEQVA